jgi:hypothetical protein
MVGGLGANLVWCKWGVVKIAASAVYGLGRVGLGEMGGVFMMEVVGGGERVRTGILVDDGEGSAQQRLCFRRMCLGKASVLGQSCHNAERGA